MTLSRSAGAHTDAVLRIERGGLKSPDASEGEIAPRMLLDGEPLALSGDKWRISPWLLVTDDTATITAFLQLIQEGKANVAQSSRIALREATFLAKMPKDDPPASE